MRGDRDPPALVDAHAPEAAVHPRDETAQADLADESFASVMTVEMKWEVGVNEKPPKVEMSKQLLSYTLRGLYVSM